MANNQDEQPSIAPPLNPRQSFSREKYHRLWLALKLFVLIFVMGSLARGPVHAQDSDDPLIRNVVWIMSDDHALHVTGAYGNEVVRTPNLDRLASEGVRFDRAFANSPVCTPSRQSMITSKLPHAVGVTLLQTPLSVEHVTIADHLGALGFKTAAIGKMHFQSNRESLEARGYSPDVIANADEHHGFEVRIDTPDYRRYLEANFPQAVSEDINEVGISTFMSGNPPRAIPDDIEVRQRWRPFQDPSRIWLNADGLPGAVYEEDSEARFFARKAVEFMEENQHDRFALVLSFYEPHSPFQFPIEYKGLYDPADMPLPEVPPESERWIPKEFRDLSEEDMRGIVRSYYQSVEHLDNNVSYFLDELERLGLDEETLVIYVSDHGYLLGHHGRFEKHMMWEEAVLAPLLIKGPSVVSGHSTEALVELIDLVPTMLDALGTPPMETAQGKSLLPLLRGDTNEHRDIVFSEYLVDNKAMVRTEQWKYIFTSGKHDLALGYETSKGPPGITHRLYDLESDPGETTNLADDPAHRSVLEEMQELMLERFMETHPKASDLPVDYSIEEALVYFCEPTDPQPIN